jgi:hypothetical protein
MHIKIVIVILILLSILKVNAQSPKPQHTLLFGLHTGHNAPFGFASGSVGYAIHPRITASIGGGLGGWQHKFGVLVMGYKQQNYLGTSVGLGYSYSNTTKETADTTTIDFPWGAYSFKGKPVHQLNIMIKRNYALFKNHRYYFGTGYALPLTAPIVSVNNGSVSKGPQQFFSFFVPGGFSINAGVVLFLRW